MSGRLWIGRSMIHSPPSEVLVVTLAPGMDWPSWIDGKDTIPPGFGTWCLSGTNIKIKVKGSQQIFIEGFQNSRDLRKEMGTCARRGTKMAAGLEAEMALNINNDGNYKNKNKKKNKNNNKKIISIIAIARIKMTNYRNIINKYTTILKIIIITIKNL